MLSFAKTIRYSNTALIVQEEEAPPPKPDDPVDMELGSENEAEIQFFKEQRNAWTWPPTQDPSAAAAPSNRLTFASKTFDEVPPAGGNPFIPAFGGFSDPSPAVKLKNEEERYTTFLQAVLQSSRHVTFEFGGILQKLY